MENGEWRIIANKHDPTEAISHGVRNGEPINPPLVPPTPVGFVPKPPCTPSKLENVRRRNILQSRTPQQQPNEVGEEVAARRQSSIHPDPRGFQSLASTDKLMSSCSSNGCYQSYPHIIFPHVVRREKKKIRKKHAYPSHNQDCHSSHTEC